jgi:hypothetical protein
VVLAVVGMSRLSSVFWSAVFTVADLVEAAYVAARYGRTRRFRSRCHLCGHYVETATVCGAEIRMTTHLAHNHPDPDELEDSVADHVFAAKQPKRIRDGESDT